MNPISRRVLIASIALGAAAVTFSVRAQQTPAPTPMTILVYEAGPAWRAGRPLAEQNLGPHLGYVAAQFRAHKVVGYGTEESATVVRGYYVLSGAAPADIDAFIKADPGVTSGALKPVETHDWRVVINGFAPREDGQTYALLRMQPGAKWVKGKPLTGQDVSGHFAYMIGKAKTGVVLAAGPDGSGQEGWYVIRGGKAAAATLLAEDPGVASGVLKPVIVGWNVIDMQSAN